MQNLALGTVWRGHGELQSTKAAGQRRDVETKALPAAVLDGSAEIICVIVASLFRSTIGCPVRLPWPHVFPTVVFRENKRSRTPNVGMHHVTPLLFPGLWHVPRLIPNPVGLIAFADTEFLRLVSLSKHAPIPDIVPSSTCPVPVPIVQATGASKSGKLLARDDRFAVLPHTSYRATLTDVTMVQPGGVYGCLVPGIERAVRPR